jgi:hypothetical protein
MSPGGTKRPKKTRLELECLEQRALLAVTFQFDYSRDLTGFFNDPVRRQTLETAGAILTSRLTDKLAAITPTATDTWTAFITDPATGQFDFAIPNLTVPADTIIVFVGGRVLSPSGDVAGVGGPGGFSAGNVSPSFLAAVQARGQLGGLAKDDADKTDFAPWGGSLVFNVARLPGAPEASGTNWYFGLPPEGLQPDQLDFFTVATHELAHLLGFGTAPPWRNHVSRSSFTGPAARAENGGSNVRLDGFEDAAGHWANGTLSNGEPTALDPELPAGLRVPFTQLDFAGLADTGWQVTGLGVAVNQPPIAANDTLSTVPFNTPALTIAQADLLANDRPGPASESGQALAIIGVGNAVGGTASLVGGSVMFVPIANVVGPVSFTYTVRDDGKTNSMPDGKNATATVTFVISDPPSVTQPATGGNASRPGADEPEPLPSPPRVRLPALVKASPNRPLRFSSKNAIALLRAAPTDLFSVTLRLSKARFGKLKVVQRGLAVDGNNSGDLTLTGSVANINRALRSLTLTPNRNTTGRALLRIMIDDTLQRKVVTIDVKGLVKRPLRR